MNAREQITRFLAAVLALLLLLGAAVSAWSYWAGEDNWHGLLEALVGLGIAWIFAGYAFGFPGPRILLRSQWRRVRRSERRGQG